MEDPTDPPFCCHSGLRTCVGGGQEGSVCTHHNDCFRGECRPQPSWRENGYGTHWYYFRVPEPLSGSDPEFVSVMLDTCPSPGSPTTWDSLIQVFKVPNEHLGVCEGLGRCADLSVCRLDQNDCADGSPCTQSPVPCNPEEQTCPLDATCVFDLALVCATQQFELIGCNDAAADSCNDPNRAKLSKLCLPDLERGRTYLVMLAGKTESNVVNYNLRLTATSACNATGREKCVGCPPRTIVWNDPPPGVVDARRPHPPENAETPEGIARVIINRNCWTVCETSANPTFHPPRPDLGLNGWVIAGDPLELVLSRAITPGEVTTLTYSDADGRDNRASFTFHPGDVSADGMVNLVGVAMLIDVLFGRMDAPWGLYSTDINRDGSLTSRDLLEVIDLLTGAGTYEIWWGTRVDPDSAACP